MPTHDLAELLTSLAAHLDAHPDLAPVNVIYPNTLQLRDDLGGAAGLVGWADTLTTPSVEVLDISERAYTHIHGSLDGHPVVVWDVAPGLVPALGADAFAREGASLRVAWISVDGLRRYADEGTVPEVIERPEDVPEIAGVVS